MLNDTPRRRGPRKPFPSLRAYFEQTGTRQSDIAADAGISEAHMSNICSGKRSPSLKLAVRLSQLTNVAVEALLATAA